MAPRDDTKSRDKSNKLFKDETLEMLKELPASKRDTSDKPTQEMNTIVDKGEEDDNSSFKQIKENQDRKNATH